jgi:hypothetical protein
VLNLLVFSYFYLLKDVNMEIWKDIENYEGYYQVSSEGNVRNAVAKQILKGDTNNIGYRRVWLYNPIKKRMFVHRLVALAFCEGYDKEKVVNHKDGDKLNNCASNLEWVTHSENDLHAFRLGLRSVCPCTFKHKIVAYKQDGTIYKIYNNTQECCDDLNVARPNVYACCNGKHRTCRGYKLAYLNNKHL